MKHKERKQNSGSTAVLTLRDAAQMSAVERESLARWLERQARDLREWGPMYADRLRARFRRVGALALAACLAALLCGCAWVQKHPAATQRIADAAAYDVSDVLLLEHPEWRPEFARAQRELAWLAAQPSFDALAVWEILRRLPAPALQTPRARIAFDGGLLVVALAGDPTLRPGAQESLRLVVMGLASGLKRRLEYGP